MDFIGSVIDESGGFSFAFCQHAWRGLEFVILRSEYIAAVDADYLQSTINEQQRDKHGCFRAALFYECETSLSSKHNSRATKKNYFVTEISYVSAEGFKQEFVNKFNSALWTRNWSFSGLDLAD
jgi:hypothetical protein